MLLMNMLMESEPEHTPMSCSSESTLVIHLPESSGTEKLSLSEIEKILANQSMGKSSSGSDNHHHHQLMASDSSTDPFEEFLQTHMIQQQQMMDNHMMQDSSTDTVFIENESNDDIVINID